MLKKKEQLSLFDKVLRLSDAGLKQKHIAQKLSKFGSEKEQQVGRACLASIEHGEGFTQGLQRFVSSNAYLCLKSGEAVGDFKLGLSDAITALSVEEASTSAIAKVLVKPLLGLMVALSAAAMAAKYLFPFLADQAKRQQWSFISSSAEQFGLFWLAHGLPILLVFTGLIVLITYSLSRYCGEWRNKLDSLPIYKQYRFIQCTNLLTAIAHQTAVGMGLKEALKHYQKHTSPYVSHHIQSMLRTIKMGKSNIGQIFNTGLLDEEELDTLILLSDTGNASVILKKSAQIHSDKLLSELSTLKVWGRRFLITLLIVVGGWVLLGLGLLAFHIATNIQF